MADLTVAGATYEAFVVVAALDNNAVQKERTKFFEFKAAVNSEALAFAALGTLVAALDAINEADIVEKGTRAVFKWNGTAVTVVGNVRKEAILSLRPSDGSDLISHTIYSPADALIAGNNVVESLAALATYLDLFEAAGDFRLSDGESIAVANQIAASRVRHTAGR